MAPNAVYVGYIVLSLALLLIVYALPIFDLRSVGQLRRRRALMAADEADYEEGELTRRADYSRPEEIVLMPRADLVMLVTLFGGIGMICAGALGFLGPRLLDLAFASEAATTSGSAATLWTATAPLERVAQVIGALCLALIALRMIRVFMTLAIFVSAAFGIHATIAYTLGRPILEPLGL